MMADSSVAVYAQRGAEKGDGPIGESAAHMQHS
jgi:hypothetical protein